MSFYSQTQNKLNKHEKQLLIKWVGGVGKRKSYLFLTPVLLYFMHTHLKRIINIHLNKEELKKKTKSIKLQKQLHKSWLSVLCPIRLLIFLTYRYTFPRFAVWCFKKLCIIFIHDAFLHVVPQPHPKDKNAQTFWVAFTKGYLFFLGEHLSFLLWNSSCMLHGNMLFLALYIDLHFIIFHYIFNL